MQSDDEKTLRSYLLGDVSNDEREQIERRLLTDRSFVAQVTLSEEDLVDEYVRDALRAGEREKFEHYFLSTPEGIGQVRLATVLERHASSATLDQPETTAAADARTARRGLAEYLRSKVWVPGYALAAAVVVVVLIGATVVAIMLRLKDELDRLRAQQTATEIQKQSGDQESQHAELVEQLNRERERRAQIEQELAALKDARGPGHPKPGVVAIVLGPGRIRGAGYANRLVVGPGVKSAVFHLVVRDADSVSYKVSLHTETGGEIGTANSLKVQSVKGRKEVQVDLPVTLLSNGNYFLYLEAESAPGKYEGVARYYFEVVRK